MILHFTWRFSQLAGKGWAGGRWFENSGGGGGREKEDDKSENLEKDGDMSENLEEKEEDRSENFGQIGRFLSREAKVERNGACKQNFLEQQLKWLCNIDAGFFI